MFCCGAKTSPAGSLDQTYRRHSGSIQLEDKRGDYLKHKTFFILHSVDTFGSSEGSSLCSVLFFVFLILRTISHGVVNIWSRTGSVVRIFRAVKAVCWALRRPFVHFTLLSVLALDQVSRRKCQTLILVPLSVPAGCRVGWTYRSVSSTTVAATRTAMRMTARLRPAWTRLCPPWYALESTCAHIEAQAEL